MTHPLADAILAGDRRALAQGITLVESRRADHRAQAEALLAAVLPDTGESIRVGISGVPGVGKSTFIEALGAHVTGEGHKIAILAVDPSSPKSGGSILGDKTRMEQLSRNPDAFIRPSPSGGTLGGVAGRTRESALLCEAAGYDVIVIETVGVGQSETAVADLVDLFLLLLVPGGGDDLQGMKKGIVELADLIVVNKADGDFVQAANRAASDYRLALGLLKPAHPDWTPAVKLVSSLKRDGIEEVWETIAEFRFIMTGNGALQARRADQALAWMWTGISETLLWRLKSDDRVKAQLPDLEKQVRDGEITPQAGAQAVLDLFLKGA